MNKTMYKLMVCLTTFHLCVYSLHQLLANTIQHEKPELEVRKTELLKTEEDLKIELAKLEESLLEVGIY